MPDPQQRFDNALERFRTLLGVAPARNDSGRRHGRRQLSEHTEALLDEFGIVTGRGKNRCIDEVRF